MNEISRQIIKYQVNLAFQLIKKHQIKNKAKKCKLIDLTQ